MDQLYGEYNSDAHEWTDGILPTLIRADVAAADCNKRWYIFDGPVDAVWIENLNTVLDDNKKLCLTSGEIMKLLPTQTMIFEVSDLQVASPATISRCGMVYMEPENLGLQSLIDRWIRSLPVIMNDYVEEITELTTQLLLPGLRIVRESLQEIIRTVDSALVQSYMNLMNFRIGLIAEREGKAQPNFAFQRTILDLLSPWAAFATVWGLGATCDYKSRCIFSDWLKTIQKDAQHKIPFPEEGLVFDYRLHDGGFIDPIEGQELIPPKWYKWMDGISSIRIKPETKYMDIIIPTVDNVRSATLIEYLLVNETNILCVGATGSGKTLTVSTKLSRNMPKKYICDFMTFSVRTTANQTQDLIDAKLDMRRKGIYGPSILTKQIFFIDDLNMPALDTFGAQPPIELIRQFMDYSGWYDKTMIGSFRLIEDVNFVAAMGPPGGGRNSITARLLRHFHIIAFPEMEDDSKMHIFKTILDSWLSNTPELYHLLDDIVDSTLKVFTIVRSEMLPVPNKLHYTFNLRDLSKVFQGILMADARKILIREKLLLLWYHENIRVFSDRLINDEDKKWFDQLLHNVLKKKFNCDADDIIGREQLFYADFCDPAGEYEQIIDIEEMKCILLDVLNNYNDLTTSPMTLMFFEDAIDHICRITRVLRQPGGNALLLGTGSGRRSVTRLSSHIKEYNCYEIEINKTYTTHNWRNDIKNIILKAGLQNQSIVFLLSGTQIKNDSMLEDLNNILNSGDVPNLYQADEVEKIFQAMQAPAQEAGLQINRSNLFSAYLRVVKSNLHIVITMRSEDGNEFNAKCGKNSIATHLLSDIKDESISDKTFQSIVKMCQYMHSSVIDASDRFLKELNRHNYVMPLSYLEFLSSYNNLLRKKKDELNSSMIRLSTGLNKLANIKAEVKNTQETLERMKSKLEKATETAARMISKITQETNEAENIKIIAKQQEVVVSKMKQENKAIRDEVEFDLSEVKLMLEAAETNLKALNKNDITEVKAMKKHPMEVRLVIEAVCILSNVKPDKVSRRGEKPRLDYWTPGSQMLADPVQFLNTIIHCKKEDITETMIDKLKSYIENPNFQPNKVLQVSKACHSLCLWIHAMYNYYFVNKKLEPKMKILTKAEKILGENETTFAGVLMKLREKQKVIKNLQNQLKEEEAKKAVLERQNKFFEEQMARAIKLIVNLSDEEKQWIAMVDNIKISLKNAVGDILLSSGAIVYLTPFTDIYHQNLLTTWCDALSEEIPHTPDCNPILTLGNQMEIRNWHINGLPRDALLIENAVLVMNSNRWPLFIDPQTQANKWIRNMCQPIGLSITKMTDKDLLYIIENCVQFGKPCLIENISTELDTSLDPVLTRTLFNYAGQPSIKIGENIVPYNFDFRLYLTTKLSNPHYVSDVMKKVLIVNFALTANGLVDQMLSLITIQEHPDLEQKRNEIIVSCAEMKQSLQKIEDKILHSLTESEGSVISIDLMQVNTVEDSKVKSEEIKMEMETAEFTQTNIDLTRSLYMPVANRAQILFFCVADLERIDIMYQYSLEWFVDIFKNSISNTEKSNDINKQIADINKNFTFAIFTNVCRSLFEKHKLHFGFLICARILLDNGTIDPKEWRHFLTTNAPIRELPNPASEWITARCWQEIQALERLSKFNKFITSFQLSLSEFKNIFDTQEAHLVPFPHPWETNLDDFEKLLVLKCLRPDKVINAIEIYLTKYLGQQFVEPQITELSTIYKESSNITPIVFIISPGTDPAAELYKFADKLKMDKKLHSISLGQGQELRAQVMLKESAEMGTWLLFQNCHLAPSWMPNLEFLIGTLSKNIHQNFRLWLTSAPSFDFPSSILQSSSKMTIEPPRGIKANMLRAYLTQVMEMQEFLQPDHLKALSFKRLIFSLCMFHSILIERQKFGPLGFNVSYDFTNGDLAICLSQLYMFLMEYDTLPLKILTYTAGHINYGGRITDDWDRRCVLTLLEDYYNANVVSQNYQFDQQRIYHWLPDAASFNDYLEYIKSFPLNDDPSLFGMHSNADINYAQAEAYACLATLLNMQPSELGVATTRVEEVTSQITEDMLSTVPKPFDLTAIQARYPILYEESFNTVLLQEAERYNSLLEIVQSTLQDLLKALRGFVVMSEQLEVMATSLFNNKIPANWRSKSYLSSKSLAGWFADLKERVRFIGNWQEQGIPPAFWLPGFYLPQAFLTGTLQNFARKHVVSIDTIDFDFKVLSSKPTEKPSNGCVIYGLFLEGCRWDGNYLIESLPKELFTDMPPILLIPEIHHVIPLHGIYICPIYRTIERSGTLRTMGHSTNFVIAMEIPIDKPQSHWIKRGVALICTLDY